MPPAFLQRRRGQIIKRFRKFAAALRKKNAARVVLLGSLQSLHQGFVQPAFFGKLRRARRASCQMRFDQLGLLLAGFAAGIENQQSRRLPCTGTLEARSSQASQLAPQLACRAE